MNENWYAVELHCHTRHSDGQHSVKELIETAVERHLDGIQLTDHNTTSGHGEAENSPIPVLKSIEWTTFFGHMHAMNCSEYVDWRDATPDSIDDKMRQVHEGGGLVGVCHPYQLGTPICTGGRWDYNVKDWSLVNYMEIWSEGCPFMNTPNKRALSLWRSLLDEGYRITPTFGRDWHRKENNVYHSACTYLLCEGESLTDMAIKRAVKKGRSAVSMGPLFYFTVGDKTVGDELTAGEYDFDFTIDFSRMKKMAVKEEVTPEKIRLITKGGATAKEIDGAQARTRLTLEEASWYNAELWGKIDGKENCLIAFTAPIYIRGDIL